MANSLIFSTETKKSGDGSLFQRRIEFHPATKSCTAFSNGSADFHLETLNPGSDSSQRSATSALVEKKSDAGDIFEHGLDLEFSFGITCRRIGAGLENLGNTCFLNSVLQCLTYTEPFAAYLQSGKHKSSCHTAGFCAMCAIQNHVSRALQSTGRILAPKDLVVNLRCISRNFRNARQEDAHEYMVNLLESMHRCCLPSGVPSESPSAYEKSLVHKIFGGRLRSQVKCMQCSYCSNTFDPFLDLSLEIVKADSLRKALAHFTAMEQLDGGERQYQCQRCKQKVKALKQLTVHKAPYVLTIHLKRFGSHVPGQKIDKKVEFGPTLDLKPFVSGSYEGDLKYTLYGVLVHAGWSTHSGHYYCFVRTSSGMWHSLDDNRVVQVSEKTVLQQKAYMLFYVRDRRNIGPRKPIDATCKENMVLSAMENRGYSVSAMNQKETIPNCPLARGLSTFDCSLRATKIDALCSNSLKEPQLKEASVLKTKVPVMAQDSSLLKDPLLDTSLKKPVKGLSVLHPCNGQVVAEGLSQSSPSSVKEINSTSYPTVATVNAKINTGNVHRGSKKVLSVPVAALPDFDGSQNYVPEKLVTNKATHEIGDAVNLRVQSKAPSKRVNNLKTEENCSVEISKQSSAEDKLNEGISNYRDPIDQLVQKAEESSKTLKEVRLIETSSLSSKMNGCIKKESPGHCRHRKVLKPKKVVMKSGVSTMHLGSKLLFRASLSWCKKKKHKRNRQHSLELRASSQFDLEEDSTSGGLGPSTSDKIQMVNSTHCQRKHRKSSRKKGNCCSTAETEKNSSGNSGMDIREGDFRERIVQNCVTLATNEPLLKSSSLTSAAKQRDTSEFDSLRDNKRELFQNGLSMLTRGLEEITVARWDGIELGPSQIIGPNNAECISIGYVPDEWDEEYDRGKRKKVRNSRNSFDGPNPFQEIATMKAKLKKVKMEKTISGNQPLRIYD